MEQGNLGVLPAMKRDINNCPGYHSQRLRHNKVPGSLQQLGHVVHRQVFMVYRCWCMLPFLKTPQGSSAAWKRDASAERVNSEEYAAERD